MREFGFGNRMPSVQLINFVAFMFFGLFAGASLLAQDQINQVRTIGRSVISINDGWYFYKYDSASTADNLIYNVIKDPGKKYLRPEGNPGNDFPFVQADFDDARGRKLICRTTGPSTDLLKQDGIPKLVEEWDGYQAMVCMF